MDAEAIIKNLSSSKVTKRRVSKETNIENYIPTYKKREDISTITPGGMEILNILVYEEEFTASRNRGITSIHMPDIKFLCKALKISSKNITDIMRGDSIYTKYLLEIIKNDYNFDKYTKSIFSSRPKVTMDTIVTFTRTIIKYLEIVYLHKFGCTKEYKKHFHLIISTTSSTKDENYACDVIDYLNYLYGYKRYLVTKNKHGDIVVTVSKSA